MLGGSKHPQARDWVVARQDDDLYQGLRVVEGQQLAHQGKGHTRCSRYIQAFALQRLVGPMRLRFKDGVFFLQVEQGP